MSCANFHIPADTPLLSRNGDRILARFKMVQGWAEEANPETFCWSEDHFAKGPVLYDEEGVAPLSTLLESKVMSAVRVLSFPAMQVWQATFDTPEDGPFEQFFPRAIFTRPADTARLKVAAAIKTILADRAANNIITVGACCSQIKYELESYGRYLEEMERAHVI